jgi:hypothetical protein
MTVIPAPGRLSSRRLSGVPGKSGYIVRPSQNKTVIGSRSHCHHPFDSCVKTVIGITPSLKNPLRIRNLDKVFILK